jgi:hypothetical protein
MYKHSNTTLLALLFTVASLAAGPSRADADTPRESAGQQTPGKPHQPTSVHAPRDR